MPNDILIFSNGCSMFREVYDVRCASGEKWPRVFDILKANTPRWVEYVELIGIEFI